MPYQPAKLKSTLSIHLKVVLLDDLWRLILILLTDNEEVELRAHEAA
jgi:hypothetical protein